MKFGDTISFAFTGDLCLGGEFRSYARGNALDLFHPLDGLMMEFADSDILVVNLEGPVFEGRSSRPKGTAVLSNDEKALKIFSGRPIGILNLANNHVMDFGELGLNSTLAAARRYGLRPVGAGGNRDDAGRGEIVVLKGKRVAFLSYTSDEPHVGAVIAGVDVAGCASYRDEDRMLENIATISGQVDFMCVCLHWGYEYFMYPSPEQVGLAHRLVDAGAKLVIGHHPHVIQGIERYGRGLILYSLGNLFFPPIRTAAGRLKKPKKMSREFLVALIDVSKDGAIGLRVLGGEYDENFALGTYRCAKADDFEARLFRLSSPIGEPGYAEFWESYHAQRERELNRESVLEAVEKAKNMPWRELASSVRFADIKRNVLRLKRIILS